MENQSGQATAHSNDGGREVALAIASVTSQVTVTVDPDNLFTERTFASVGVTINTMAGVKDALKGTLPEIAVKIDQIPTDPNQNVGEVAEFVRLCLLGT